MSAPHPNPELRLGLRRAAWACAVLTVGATLFIVGSTLIYARFGTKIVNKLDRAVGEMLMREGQRIEAGGTPESAKERYHAALQARFGGQQNRTFTLKLLGTLHWKSGDFDSALPLLKEAIGRAPLEPTYYEPYCDILYQQRHFDQMTAVLNAWKTAATKSGRKASLADVSYYEGLFHLSLGRRAEARSAFREGALLAPGGRSAEQLALLLHADGEDAEARRWVEECLIAGGSEALRALHRELGPAPAP